MSPNPIDRKLASVFKSLRNVATVGAKRDKAAKDFRELRARVVDEHFGKTLEKLFEGCSAPAEKRTPPNADDAGQIVRELNDRAFSDTSECLFLEWRSTLAAVPLERVVQFAPSALALEAWRKTARIVVKEAEEKLLLDPERIYATAGADWLLFYAKPEKLSPLLELFLTKKLRSKHVPPWADALAAVLKKDKRGELLKGILRSHQSEERLTALADVVRLNRTVMRVTVESLPEILGQKDSPPAVAALLGHVFGKITVTTGAEREFLSAALARLGSGILMMDRRNPQADAVLELIQRAARQLRNFTKDEQLRFRTWIFECLSGSEEPADGRLHVTMEGARHLALAFDKATQGFAAKDILTVTARNLGLVAIGRKGETVNYKPIAHEDLEGGMLPGDPAIVQEAGWSHQGEVIVRAKVNKPEAQKHA